MESLLPSRVPEVEFGGQLGVDLDRFGLVVYSDGHCILGVELVLEVPLNEAAFSGGCLADHNDFEGEFQWVHVCEGA